VQLTLFGVVSVSNDSFLVTAATVSSALTMPGKQGKREKWGSGDAGRMRIGRE